MGLIRKNSSSVSLTLGHALKFVCVAICLVVSTLCLETDGHAPVNARHTRDADDTQQPQPSENSGESGNIGNGVSSSSSLRDIIRHLSMNDGSIEGLDLQQYTPPTPSPEEVNCYVEVPVTRRIGGRCIHLGSNTMGCQAGVYLAMSNECMELYSQQHYDLTTQNPTTSSQGRRRAGRRRGQNQSSP